MDEYTAKRTPSCACNNKSLNGGRGHPPCQSPHSRTNSLEGAEDCQVFSSGMGAISAVLETFLKPDDRLVCARNLYGGTYTLVTERLPELGIEVELVSTDDMDAWRSALEKPAKLLYCESITNPTLMLADVKTITALVHDQGALAVIDNTFATPINLRPLEMGMDLIIHSGSKYLRGHSDLICGAVSGSSRLIDPIWKRRTIGGACLDPQAAFLLERGLKTLAVRVDRQTRMQAISQALWTAEELRQGGIRAGTMRLSVGIEAVEDLLTDLKEALS